MDAHFWTTLYIDSDQSVRCLLALAADPNFYLDGIPTLLAAVRHESFNCMQALLEGGADPNAAVLEEEPQRCAQGTTALMIAAKHGDVSMIHALLAAGADPSRGNSRGETLLHFAALYR